MSFEELFSSPVVYVIAVVLLSVLGVILAKTKANGTGPVSDLLSRLREDFVSYERVRGAVEALLMRTGLPDGFVDWLDNVGANIMLGVPRLVREGTKQQVIDVMAAMFSAQNKTDLMRQLGYTVELEPLLEQSWSAKRVFYEIAESDVAKKRITSLITQAKKRLGA